MNTTTVITHRSDFDGIFSQEIARIHLGNTATYIGWDYGDPVPDISPDTDLYLIDISIDELMTHSRLVWIDHHKTAMEKYKHALEKSYCIDGVAACRLAWQYFAQGRPSLTKEDYVERKVTEPLSVRLAGEFDVWDKRDPRADVFQYGLKSVVLDQKVWSALLNKFSTMHDSVRGEAYNTLQGILDYGGVVRRYAQLLDANAIATSSFDLKFEGLTFLALNTTKCNSLTFESGVKEHHDGVLSFRYEGNDWVVSLYGVPHKPEVDLSVIATKMGGGGHKQACGFRCATPTFLGE